MKYYPQPCNVCGTKLQHSNKRGRPPVVCSACRGIKPVYHSHLCLRCDGKILRTGKRGRPAMFCEPCLVVVKSIMTDEVPF
jgi:formamidopyrimidine-DNA glycosylase